MTRLFNRKILAAARTSTRIGIQIRSSSRVCSIITCEPRSRRTRNNPSENGSITCPSTLIQTRSCMSIHTVPSTLENTLP